MGSDASRNVELLDRMTIDSRSGKNFDCDHPIAFGRSEPNSSCLLWFLQSLSDDATASRRDLGRDGLPNPGVRPREADDPITEDTNSVSFRRYLLRLPCVSDGQFPTRRLQQIPAIVVVIDLGTEMRHRGRR